MLVSMRRVEVPSALLQTAELFSRSALEALANRGYNVRHKQRGLYLFQFRNRLRLQRVVL